MLPIQTLHDLWILCVSGDGHVMDFIDNLVSPACPRPHLLSHGRRSRRASRGAGSHAVSGIVRRSRSIQINADQLPGRYTLSARFGLLSNMYLMMLQRSYVMFSCFFFLINLDPGSKGVVEK